MPTENMNTYANTMPREIVWKAAFLDNLQKKLTSQAAIDINATVPLHSSNTAMFRRPIQLSDATPKQEGVQPPSEMLQFTDHPVVLQWFPKNVQITKEQAMMGESGIREQITKEGADAIARGIEAYRFGAWSGSANQVFAGGASSIGEVNSNINLTDLYKIKRSFEVYTVEKFTKFMGASTKIATNPVPESWLAYAHPDILVDAAPVLGDFQFVSNYSSPPDALVSEEGCCKTAKMRFISTTFLKPRLAAGASSVDFLSNGVEPDPDTPVAADVYPVLFIGLGGVGAISLEGLGKTKIDIVDPGSTARSINNPGGDVGWTYFLRVDGTAVLDPIRVKVLWCCASASPKVSAAAA